VSTGDCNSTYFSHILICHPGHGKWAPLEAAFPENIDSCTTRLKMCALSYTKKREIATK